MKKYSWFKDRIGKTIYRNNTYCCKHCYHVYLNGLILANEQHAGYVYDCYCEMPNLEYFDTRAEALAYERKHLIRLQWNRFTSWIARLRMNYRMKKIDKKYRRRT